MVKKFAFNIGDLVWFMHNNIAMSGSISKMFYKESINPVDFESVIKVESYTVSVGDRVIDTYDKDKLFNTKEELLKSL